jgi:hypothetical protein
MGGAAAGAVAAGLWAVQQPLDKRVFRSDYDDVELVGKLVTRDAAWPLVGLVIHLQNGALFGAVYARLRPVMPGPPVLAGIVVALVENLGTWPLSRLSDRLHPARGELAPLTGNRRALAQSTWRHLLFCAVLGELERRLNAPLESVPPPVPISSDGHGDIEHAVAAA